ncbi:MAG: quinone oxidoreductase [Alphaproteobacteria bacterium]|nr:quinone oxidoreductase [Alphaproteobacteria bacterium]
MSHAIVIHAPGGPEVLCYEPVTVGAPGAGDVRIEQTAIGINFHDIYVRTGLYRTLAYPGIPGVEAAGVVVAVGSGVASVKPGDRVAYVSQSYGAYASERLIAADLLVPIPALVDDRTAAGTLTRGLTVLMLTEQTHRIRAGDRVLVHAAAGGVGQLLCQYLRHLGAIVIGTVGSEAKAAVARACGCAEVIDYRRESFVDRVRALTGGKGVDVAYDSVGKDTFLGSLESLAVFGHLVNFGQSSGAVDPFPVALLSRKSNSVSRPLLFHYIAETVARRRMAAALFGAIARGAMKPSAVQAFSLRDAGRAHQAFEARRMTAVPVLVP